MRPILAAVLLLAAPALAQNPEAELETVRVSLADGGELEVDRGVLNVPVVRAQPDSMPITVEYHRFRADPAHADRPPIFLLRGGPGFRGLGPQLRSKGFYEKSLQRLVALADVVVVGQRGIGSSLPDTLCKTGPAREDLSRPSDPAAHAAALADACRACREHWEAEGLDLRGLNVLEAADDVIGIADALGYERIAITGTSFGSHWAMAVMRRHPDRVARAVLGGIEGPDHTYDMPSFVLGALERIAAAAEASPRLEDALPEDGLLGSFRAAIARLEDEPVTVEAGKNTVLVDAHRLRAFALGVTAGTSSRDGIRTWPADLIRIANGDYESLAWKLVARNFLPRLPTASFFMLDCGSGISAERLATLLADPAADVVGPLGDFYRSTCPAWDADLGDEFRLEFETDVPTVLVQGTWDTSTPFENALEMEPRFTNGKLVVVEGGSHGALMEAVRADEDFAAAIEAFLATGDMDPVPTRVALPPVDWALPD